MTHVQLVMMVDEVAHLIRHSDTDVDDNPGNILAMPGKERGGQEGHSRA